MAAMPRAVRRRERPANGPDTLHRDQDSEEGSWAVKALVRWKHPEQGLLGPDQFISLAEESGSTSTIGRWVLRVACTTLKRWTEAKPVAARVAVAVNLSVAQLRDPDLVKDVQKGLERSGLAPDRLHLEVTDSVLTSDPESAALALGQLRDLGSWLVIDDFGTGNSSLTALQHFLFRVLKIDRSFVGGLGVRPELWPQFREYVEPPRLGFMDGSTRRWEHVPCCRPQA
jgi:EAL domain-containing protein (putative c-di-GMP-specific phosphodiesterase class I)